MVLSVSEKLRQKLDNIFENIKENAAKADESLLSKKLRAS